MPACPIFSAQAPGRAHGLVICFDRIRAPLKHFLCDYCTSTAARPSERRVLFSLRPVSAHSGRKEFIETKVQRTVISEGRSPFRGHGGAVKRAREIIAIGSGLQDWKVL